LKQSGRLWVAPVLGAVLVLSAGCTAGSDTTGAGSPTTVAGEAPAFDESQADTSAAFTLRDYGFEGPTVVKGPKVVFTAENEGLETHELEILDASGEAVGEIEAFAPGGSAPPLAVELEPGTYQLQCILTTSGGQVHKALGMEAVLTVE